MADTPKEIKFAIEFPQGHVLFMKDTNAYSNSTGIGGIYFRAHDSAHAFLVYGERKELFGKNAVTVGADRDTGATGYSVVHEFNAAGQLVDARLVSKEETLTGKLVDDAALAAMNAELAADKIRFLSQRDTELARVFNVASFPDGRLLVQLFNRNELYLGTPGNYEKLDAQLQAQGGNSMYYKLASGESIELPYSFGGPGRNDVPKFGDQELKYLDVKSGDKPEKYGLTIKPGVTPLTPFSPGLARKP